MWGHVAWSANGQQYKIKINKEFLMRKRGDVYGQDLQEL